MEEKQIEIAGIQEVDMFTGRNNYDILQKFVDGGYYSNAYFQKSIDYSGGEYGNGTLSIYPFLRNYNIANGKDNVWYDTVKNEDSGSTKSLCIDNIITTRNIKVNKVDMYESELSDHNLFYAECEFLDEEQPSFQFLDIRVDEASDYDEEKYTPASYAKLQKAMEDAKQLSSQASQAEINAAVDALESAMEGLERKTDSQVAESQKIVLPKTQKDNLHTRIVIKEANMKNGQFGLCEVEIGENIEAMEPEYLPLPDAVLNTEAIKNSKFTTWEM